MNDTRASAMKNLLSLTYAAAICAIALCAFYFLGQQAPVKHALSAEGKDDQRQERTAVRKSEANGAAGPAETGDATVQPASPAESGGMVAARQAEETKKKSADQGEESAEKPAAEKSEDDLPREEQLPGDPQAGEQLFAQHCAHCHGADARGQIGPDLTRKEFKYGKSAEELTESIAEGRPGGMPAFDSQLSKSQTADLAAYILSL